MKYMLFLIAFLVMNIGACTQDNEPMKNGLDKTEHVVKVNLEPKGRKIESAIIEPVETAPFTAKEKTSKFRNCRARLIPLKNTSSETGIISGVFTISENPDYDPVLGDACKGDLANLWQDIEQYDKLGIRVSGFTMITRELDLFPKTQRELILFVDDAVKANRAEINPEQYNRKILDDVLKLRRKYLSLIRHETPKYFAAVHAPIINGYLEKHNLKLKEYSAGEKLSFCYAPWDNCVTYFPPNKDFTTSLGLDLDVLYIASWDLWLSEDLKTK